DESGQEEWFINHFHRDSSPFFGDNLEEICGSIKTAIIRHYLISNNYISKLLLKRKQLRYIDSYGDLVEEDWNKEVKKFTKKRSGEILEFIINHTPEVIYKELKKQKQYYYLDSENFYYEILSIVDLNEVYECTDLEDRITLLKNIDNVDTDNYLVDEQKDYHEYESIVSNMFEILGWDTLITPKSGDQGTDIIIEKYNMKFVVQCKLYSQPVGNKAVQEVIAAKGFYEAFGAIVVTNNDYTKSARQLAESHSVILLHDSQILEWNNIFDES
ncbi:TPA: restriction endonuclease, partial [Acinetobacter baumannii]